MKKIISIFLICFSFNLFSLTIEIEGLKISTKELSGPPKNFLEGKDSYVSKTLVFSNNSASIINLEKNNPIGHYIKINRKAFGKWIIDHYPIPSFSIPTEDMSCDLQKIYNLSVTKSLDITFNASIVIEVDNLLDSLLSENNITENQKNSLKGTLTNIFKSNFKSYRKATGTLYMYSNQNHVIIDNLNIGDTTTDKNTRKFLLDKLSGVITNLVYFEVYGEYNKNSFAEISSKILVEAKALFSQYGIQMSAGIEFGITASVTRSIDTITKKYNTLIALGVKFTNEVQDIYDTAESNRIKPDYQLISGNKNGIYIFRQSDTDITGALEKKIITFQNNSF